MPTRTRLISDRKCYLYGTVLATTIFAFDLWHPLGVASATPYIALPLLGLLARSPRAVVNIAVLGTLLTIAGMFLSTAAAPLHVALLNRTMSMALIWIVAIIAIKHLAVGDRLRNSLRKAAFRDPLTGLYNRRYIFDIFRNELNRHQRYGIPFSLILIDADHFKRINDQYGHNAGDAALKAIANVCTASVRDIDVVGRFGGEEFIILLPSTHAAEAAVVAERIRRTMRREGIEFQGKQIDVTLSLGVAEVGPNADTFDDLLKAADEALYSAKRGGRDQTALAKRESELPDSRAA